MSTYLDYAGRIVDVAAFRGARAAGDTLLTAELVDDESGGEVCTGAEMVAQAWLAEFLTEEGSVPYAPEKGCGFMAAARLGRLLTETEVFQYFNLSTARVRRALVNAEDPADHPEDRFASATLDRVVIAPDGASLRVTVRTLAGTTRKVILPIPLVV